MCIEGNIETRSCNLSCCGKAGGITYFCVGVCVGVFVRARVGACVCVPVFVCEWVWVRSRGRVLARV